MATGCICASGLMLPLTPPNEGLTMASLAPAPSNTAPGPFPRAALAPLQERFKPAVVARRGFEYRAERPEGRSFVDQKWAWSGRAPGGYLLPMVTFLSTFLIPRVSNWALFQLLDFRIAFHRAVSGRRMAALPCMQTLGAGAPRAAS
jgi:hypothetical protein